MSIGPNRWYADFQKTTLNYAKIKNVREIPRLVGMLLMKIVFKDSELSERSAQNSARTSSEHNALNSERCARNNELSEHSEQNSALSERSALKSETSFHQNHTNVQISILFWVHIIRMKFVFFVPCTSKVQSTTYKKYNGSHTKATK